MQALIDPDNARYQLGYPIMDDTHGEFIALINKLGDSDKASFISLFQKLIEHTDAHFAAENELMDKSRFPASNEHKEEHQRILGEMHRMGKKVASGSTMMARAYIKEQMPQWFDLHAATMDSALAAHLKDL